MNRILKYKLIILHVDKMVEHPETLMLPGRIKMVQLLWVLAASYKFKYTLDMYRRIPTASYLLRRKKNNVCSKYVHICLWLYNYPPPN